MNSEVAQASQGRRRKYLETQHWMPAMTGEVEEEILIAEGANNQVTLEFSPNRRSGTLMQWHELGTTIATDSTEITSENVELGNAGVASSEQRQRENRYTYLLNAHFFAIGDADEITTRNLVDNRVTHITYANCDSNSQPPDQPIQAQNVSGGGRREMGTRFTRLFMEHFAVVTATAADENPAPPLAIDVSAADGNPSLILSPSSAAAAFSRVVEEVASIAA